MQANEESAILNIRVVGVFLARLVHLARDGRWLRHHSPEIHRVARRVSKLG